MESLSIEHLSRHFPAKLFRRLCTVAVPVLYLTAFLFLPHPEKIHAAGTLLIGEQTVESTQDSDSAGSAEAFQATASTSGTVGSFSVYVDSSNSASKLIVGLYSNSSGNPGTLLGTGSSTGALTPGAWNTVLVTPTAVTANTLYWIAVLGTGGTLFFRDGGTNCLSASSSQTTLTSMPASWSTGQKWSSCRLSAYGSASATSPILTLSASSLSFSATVGGANPASSSVSITNTGTGGTLSYTSTSDSSWLTATPSSTTPGTLQVTVTVGALTAATYTGHITVTSTGAQGSPATITVTFTVTPSTASATLALSTTSISFNAVQGGTNPASSSVSVTNTGAGGTISYTAASDSSWLTVTPSGTTPGTLRVTATVGTLTAATYTGHITVTSMGAQGSPATITVTFTVTPSTASATLSLSTTSLSFNAIQGGANPAPSSVVVTNTGTGGSLRFSAAATDSDTVLWLSVSPTSSRTSATLTISAKVGTLSAGTHTGKITVTSSGALNSPAIIAVTFNVAAPVPTLSLSTSAVSLSGAQGSGSSLLSTSVNVTNSGGGGALTFTASVNNPASTPWLTVNSGGGTTPGSVGISAVVGALAAGVYTGSVNVAASGASNSPLTISVTFTVTPPPPVLSLATMSVSLAATQGSGVSSSPASVNVSNTGGGTLSFTTSSNSAWLSVTPGSGTAPNLLQISASPGTLPVGSYSGNITVMATGAQGSPATIAVTFLVVPILGDSIVESITDSVSSGQAQAVQATANATGSVNSLRVYLDSSSAASQVSVGIYADNGGHPGTLLGQGNLGQGGSTKLPAGWNSIAISTGNVSVPNVAVTAGMPYWVAMLGAQGGAPVYRAALMSGCSSEISPGTGLTALPATWTGASGSVCPVSIYAMLAPQVSGTISGIPNGAGPALVTLAGAPSGTTTTDASGNFTFSVLANQSYTVTPSISGYSFTPATQTVNVLTSSVSGVNFATLYSISGNVSAGAGVTIYLSGPTSASTTSDSLGNFSFSGLTNAATYVITPSDIGYIFVPLSKSVTIQGANATGVNFSANTAPPGYTISGKITLSSKGLGGESTVTLTTASTGAIVTSTTADSSGNFSLTEVPNGSYIVTPSSSTAAFTPASVNVTINGVSYTTANFTAAGLVFYDDFTGTSLGSAWTTISRHGEYGQNETECNIPQMVSVANSALTITTEPTPPSQPQLGVCGDFNVDGTVRHTPSSWPYITGDIQWTSLNFTYGTIEIRAKFPTSATNLWPATWLLGNNCQLTNIYTADTGYSTCPALSTSGYTEIDMTECYNSGGWCQFHVANPGFGVCDASYPVDTNYHIFKTVWTSTSIQQYMDGSLITACNQHLGNPMFLLIQTQTGGVGGTPSNANLPAQFSVDYVKVTQP